MRLVSLSLKGYRQFFERTEIQIPMGLIGICGANGVGKSKLIEAIGYALFGPRSVLPTADKDIDLVSAASSGPTTTEVCLVVEVRDQFYRIRRSRKAKDCSIDLIVQDEASQTVITPLATSPSEVTKKVIELFGITPEAYLRTFVARQKEIAGIQAIKSSDRQKLINRLIGIAQVEKALSLAESERKQRTDVLEAKIADEGEAANVALAQGRLRELQHTLDIATAKEKEHAIELENARRATLDGRKTREALNTKSAEAQGIREDLAKLAEALNDLEAAVKEAAVRYEVCVSAQAQVEAADKVLEETQEAPNEVVRHKTLKDLAAARQQHEEAVKGLEVAQTNFDDHRVCEDQLHQISRRVETLQAETAKQEGLLTSAQAKTKESTGRASIILKRLLTVQTMGASGICERCGQRLGDNLGVAIDGLRSELENAEILSKETANQEQNLVEALQLSLQEVEDAVKERDRLQKQFHHGSMVPGQFEAAQHHHEACQRALQNFPEDLWPLSYDVAAHHRAEADMRRRADAEGERRANEQLALQRQDAEAAQDRAKRQLEQNQEQQETLAIKLKALEDIEILVATADERLSMLEAEEASATTRWQQAAFEQAQAEAALTPAQEKVQQAIVRAEKIAVLRHNAEIAQRTEALLRLTRDEITAQSCPRLSDMMDSWARSLMGSHFRTVQLTPDYRIEADNGSGLHAIDHFSGGEQTLLAVMLRVAISLYCHERLGMGPGFLVLDEVFGDQDELHRAQLVQFLNEIKPYYQQILIVNHVADVTDRLGSIIEVTSTGENTSKAVLRL